MKRPVDRTSTAIIAAAAVLAAGITLDALSRPGFLFGITPDISVWIGASVRLIHGAVPYRDFDLIQPPEFARDALAVLRHSSDRSTATA